ncbi:MAG: OmpA family protein, partial [Alphaproteobacteria bacterium]|nr:OmpA family protein [Alphaproteobacteria bacterium]
MNFPRLAALLLATSLVAGPALAEDNPPADPSTAEQGESLPQDLAALLADERQASELSNEELAQRFELVRTYLEQGGLPKKLRKRLTEMAQDDRRELARRDQGGEQQNAEQPQSTETPSIAEGEPAQETMPVGSQIPDEVLAFIQDDKPLSELSDEDLAARARLARDLSGDKSLPKDVRNQLALIGKKARQTLAARAQQAEQQQSEETQQQQAEETTPPATETQTSTQAPANDQQQVQALDGNKADPTAEAKAGDYLGGAVTVDQLSDDELRARLEAMRDLMAGNQLSRRTEKALRQKLRVEREILRQRIARLEAEKEAERIAAEAQPANEAAPKVTAKDIIEIEPVDVVLKDSRPADDLEDYELRRRIDVYKVATADDQYDEASRDDWQEALQRDRGVLRHRLIEEKRRRELDLRRDYESGNINIDITIELDPDREPAHDVFAAEVDDEEIEDVLVAPPRRRIDRRYTVEEIEDEPDLRDALPRIEIDTVHFGFGEAFIREEEVENLDRIAEIMERILIAHPREVFFIEGHTDAVGSSAYNLDLSRQRAMAIKKA